jgi:putative transposase
LGKILNRALAGEPDRLPVILAGPQPGLLQIMRDARADFGAELQEFTGEPDHVHVLVHVPPTMTMSRLVNSRNSVPSRRRRQEFPELRRHNSRAKRPWSGSHIASSLGQRTHHRLASVHRAAEPPIPTGSRPAAFTTGLKAGALAAL